jgi:hypothetical protein
MHQQTPLHTCEIVPLASVVLLPVTLPPVIFPDIVVLSPVICATTELMTVNAVTDRVATPPRMTNIANIAVAVMDKYASSGVYKVANSDTRRWELKKRE